MTDPESPLSKNPLLARWPGPYGGVPPFDRVRIEWFEPALEEAMAEHLAEVDRIARDPEAPTFQNTLEALESSGRTLDRVSRVYGIWSANVTTPEFQALEREMAPKLSAHSDRILQNEALFRRIEAVYTSGETERLTPEQQRLAWRYYTTYVRAGAKLGAAAKARIAEINQRLSTLFTSFNENLLADETDLYLVVENEAELAGLPKSARDAAAAAAVAKGEPGKWLISNTRSSVDPVLVYADSRELRERAWRMFVSRGDMSGEHDNKAIVAEMLALRSERATLRGYATHAHFRVENAMAKTPERAMELMEAVWKAAVARAREEVADVKACAGAEGATFQIQPWDHRYYAEKVRKDRYDLDRNAVTPYLQLDRLREGMFWVARELFDFHFEPAVGVPVFHPDVTVWEVRDTVSGRHVGLWYFDPFARPGKRSGAWMNVHRAQSRFAGEETAIVSNNSNFLQGGPGDPVLISWDDATTLFHEFGHALNGLASNVSYPSLSGTPPERDYVEFPSQLLEHWLATPEVLQRFAVHHRTGEPIPQDLVDRIRRAANFSQGLETVEYLASALLDMKLHLEPGGAIDLAGFEEATLAGLGMPAEIVMRHRIPHFQHAFGSDSYSAGYYGYLWADVLTADAFEAFTEAGGPYDRSVMKRLRDSVFSTGSSLDPAEAYRRFRGRDAASRALMRKRGFSVEADGGAPRKVSLAQ